MKCRCAGDEHTGIHDKKERGTKEKKDLVNRLKRIEGQIRGLERMVEEDAYCPDILTQSAAVKSAVQSFSTTLLETHIKTCVAKDIKKGNDETIEELIWILKKLM